MNQGSVNLGASAEAIQHHYDVGNEFYQLWLDSSCTYSCALWEGNDTLEQAQTRKLDYHIFQSRAERAGRVLDVGCGWGSLLKRLVQAHGVGQAVGLTLSEKQAKHIIGFNEPRITVRLESWQDHLPEQAYDAIISVGAFEHFAQSDLPEAKKVDAYRQFFKRCHDWLKPGGFISLQSIAYENSGREDLPEFISKTIFPESDLPRLAEIAKASERLFEIVLVRNERNQYEKTIREWRQRLIQHREEAVRLVGEETVARYDKYLQLSLIGFHIGTTGLLRITLRRVTDPRGAFPSGTRI